MTLLMKAEVHYGYEELWLRLTSPDRSNAACWGQLECYSSLFGFKSTSIQVSAQKRNILPLSVVYSSTLQIIWLRSTASDTESSETSAQACVKLFFGECGLSLIVLGVNINIPQYYYEPKQHISGSVLRNYIGVGNSPVSYSSWCWVRWKSPGALGMESARSTAWISLVYMLTVPVAL